MGIVVVHGVVFRRQRLVHEEFENATCVVYVEVIPQETINNKTINNKMQAGWVFLHQNFGGFHN
jgi:hypothetical protein